MFFTWQAYTVELEAELNQLKEENAQLRQALVLPNYVRLCRMLKIFIPSCDEVLVIQLY